MQYKIVEINPSAPYEVQGRGLEEFIAAGYELHGPPIVWREQLLQVVVKHDTAGDEKLKLQRGPGTAKTR